MDRNTVIAALLAPLLGPLLWKVLLAPGGWLSDRVWQMPDSRLRTFLLLGSRRSRQKERGALSEPRKPL